jgi:hypothetical protein
MHHVAVIIEIMEPVCFRFLGVYGSGGILYGQVSHLKRCPSKKIYATRSKLRREEIPGSGYLVDGT